ncbi:MAG: phytoene desaturase, partial [Mycobacterium sp.]|nr:phytoene desaturase [Mycobacterium sp.]
MARIVVIGAGVGGLAAATRLQSLGHQVTVCEQSGSVGGKLGTYSRDGYRFDTGPSLLTLPAVFAELFAATGDPLERTLELRRVDPHCRYRFADGSQLDVPADRKALAAAIHDAFGPEAARDWL